MYCSVNVFPLKEGQRPFCIDYIGVCVVYVAVAGGIIMDILK
jgi:hypothetical protein